MKDDQDNLFMAAPTLNFNIIEEDHMEQQNKQDNSSPPGDFEKIDFSPRDFHDARDGNEQEHPVGSFNPFTDTLANSEAVPVTQKLISVEI